MNQQNGIPRSAAGPATNSRQNGPSTTSNNGSFKAPRSQAQVQTTVGFDVPEPVYNERLDFVGNVLLGHRVEVHVSQ